MNTQGDDWKKVNKKQLINILNYINFQDDSLFINFSHTRYGNFLSVKAKPLPCSGDILNCQWLQSVNFLQKLNLYSFSHFHFLHNQKVVFIKPEIKDVNTNGISFKLPEIGYEISSRKVNRHPGKNIHVEFIQNGIVFHGVLIDISTFSFSIKITASPPQTFQWINLEHIVYIIFKKGQEILYSGECKIIRQSNDNKNRLFVLEPLQTKIRRFKPKKFRSLRHRLSPSPVIIFQHPLTRKTIHLELEELSGSGFSVMEDYNNSVLLVGMIIPKLDIEFMNHLKLTCKAQVINRNLCTVENDKVNVKSGIAILDMDIQTQAKFASLLHKLTDQKSYVCHKVNLDDLWKFFFETGFVYPHKYASIHENKKNFKKTYNKLYMQNPHIARHFIHQDK
ncbi:MAG: pilus assembly protein PilZ, partial [bacterium]|nr:pilus assembly protein PilZ [bacterium]